MNLLAKKGETEGKLSGLGAGGSFYKGSYSQREGGYK